MLFNEPANSYCCLCVNVNAFVLIMKLMKNFNLHPILVKLLFFHLKHRWFKFKLFNSNTEFTQSRGLPQGSCLGPCLFSLFINDISTILTVPHILYADDLVLYSSSTNLSNTISLPQSNIDKLEEWCTKNNLKINIDKCKVQCFSKKSLCDNDLNMVKLFISNIELELVDSFKYLGVIFDNKLDFKMHFDSVTVKIGRALKHIRGIKRFLTEKAFVMIFNAYVLPYFDQCCEVYVNQRSNVNELQQKIYKLFYEFFYLNKLKKLRKMLIIVKLKNLF